VDGKRGGLVACEEFSLRRQTLIEIEKADLHALGPSVE
jgi:hypothetical protein